MLCSKTVLAGVFAMVVSSVALPRANAGAPTVFEFGGVFTRTTGTVHQVGDPFTTIVFFDFETPDLDPSPLQGRYTYLSWIAPYRTATPITLVPPSGAIEITADDGSHNWRLENVAATFRFELAINFPSGTFLTDALPPTLDLSQATATRFEAAEPAFGMDLRGTITSLRVVPEPGLSSAILLGTLFGARRARRIR